MPNDELVVRVMNEGAKGKAPPGTDPDELAQAIIDVAAAAKRILASKLSRRAIIVLIKDSVGPGGPGLREIEQILEHAAALGHTYVKKPVGGASR